MSCGVTTHQWKYIETFGDDIFRRSTTFFLIFYCSGPQKSILHSAQQLRNGQTNGHGQIVALQHVR
jgi:hypothetical protein